MVETYATRVPMFTTAKTSTEMFVERYSPIDNVSWPRSSWPRFLLYIFVHVYGLQCSVNL